MPQYVIKNLKTNQIVAAENNIHMAAWFILNDAFPKGWKVDVKLEPSGNWCASLVTFDPNLEAHTNKKTKRFVVRSDSLHNLNDDVLWLVLIYSRQFGFVVAEVY